MRKTQKAKKKLNLPTMSFKSSAILNLNVKSSKDYKTGIHFEFPNPETIKNDVLLGNFGQTIANVKLMVTDDGHFGFRPIADSAHTFQRDTSSYFFI